MKNLNLKQMRMLSGEVQLLVNVGGLLENNGFGVSFNLTPHSTQIEFDALSGMIEAERPVPVTDGITVFDLSDKIQKAGAERAVAECLERDLQIQHGLAVAEQIGEALNHGLAEMGLEQIDLTTPEEHHDIEPPAPQDEGQSNADVTVAVAEEAGGAPEVAPPLSPAPPAPPASEPQKLTIAPLKGLPGLPAPWTEHEDEIVIGTAAAMRLKGDLVGKISEALAGMLQRPTQGVYFRMNNKLKAPIHRRHQELIAEVERQAKVATNAPVQTTAEMVKAAIGEVLAEDAKTPMGLHLAALPRAGKWSGWTVQRDVDLLDLAISGWNLPEIAAELGLSDNEIKQRFELLTSGRQFKRNEVHDALKAMLGGQA